MSLRSIRSIRVRVNIALMQSTHFFLSRMLRRQAHYSLATGVAAIFYDLCCLRYNWLWVIKVSFPSKWTWFQYSHPGCSIHTPHLMVLWGPLRWESESLHFYDEYSGLWVRRITTLTSVWRPIIDRNGTSYSMFRIRCAVWRFYTVSCLRSMFCTLSQVPRSNSRWTCVSKPHPDSRPPTKLLRRSTSPCFRMGYVPLGLFNPLFFFLSFHSWPGFQDGARLLVISCAYHQSWQDHLSSRLPKRLCNYLWPCHYLYTPDRHGPLLVLYPVCNAGYIRTVTICLNHGLLVRSGHCFPDALLLLQIICGFYVREILTWVRRLWEPIVPQSYFLYLYDLVLLVDFCHFVFSSRCRIDGPSNCSLHRPIWRRCTILQMGLMWKNITSRLDPFPDCGTM